MPDFKRIFQLLQALSIDVVTGACAMSYLIAHMLEISLPGIIYLELGAAVWLIYTMDHLLDAKSISHTPSTFRHLFHKNHSSKLTWVWLTVFLISTILGVVFLPIDTIKFGLLAMVIVIAHFVLVRLIGHRISVFIHKELGVGMAYAIGVFVGPFSLSTAFDPILFIVPIQVFLLAMINLLQFSFFEHEIDEKQNQTSMSRNLGKKLTGNLILTLLVIQSLILSLCLLTLPALNTEWGFLSIITGSFWLIWIGQSYFSRRERYRAFGDGIFNLPLLLILFT